MSSIADGLVVIAVLALVVGRQFKARRMGGGRRVWLIPLVLAVVALRDPHLIDPAHRGPSVVLLTAGVVLEVAMGCAWGWTTRIWREADGTVWVRGTRATAAAWLGMVVARVALYAVGSAFGVRRSGDELLLALAALLLVRGMVVGARARGVLPYRVPSGG